MNKNNVIFIINDLLEFSPGKKTIRIINENKEIKLNTPTNECLFLILSRKDEIVLHDDFFKSVWEINGEVVSTNTLYQNISIIRKNIKKLGFFDDFLITIPKKGFKLSENIHVTIIDDSDDSDIINTTNNFNSKKKKLLSIFFIACFLSIIFLMYLLSLNKKNIVNNYAFEGNIRKCHVYSKVKLNKKTSLEEMLTQSRLDCNKYKYIYISNRPYSDIYSIVECNTELNLNDKVSCNVHIFKE